MGTYDAYYFLEEAINAWGWIAWPTSRKFETVTTYLSFDKLPLSKEFDRELASKKFREFLDVIGYEGPASFHITERTQLDPKYVGQSALPIIKELWPDPSHVPNFVKERWPEYFKIETKEIHHITTEEVVEYINE